MLSVYSDISVYSQYDPYSECRKHLQATDHKNLSGHKQLSVICKLLCFVPHVHRPHVRLQKLPLVMKDSLHLPKDLCRAKQAVKCLQSGWVHACGIDAHCCCSIWYILLESSVLCQVIELYACPHKTLQLSPAVAVVNTRSIHATAAITRLHKLTSMAAAAAENECVDHGDAKLYLLCTRILAVGWVVAAVTRRCRWASA